MLSQDIIIDLTDGLCDIFKTDLNSIILYGSVARNQETSESDVDVAIILNASANEIQREAFIKLSAKLDLEYDKVFSIVDIEKSKIDKWGEVLPFYRNILNEGVVLWTAA